MSTINFTALGLTGTGLVNQSGAESFTKVQLPNGVFPSTITETTTLTNPANAYYFVQVSAPDQQINLMPMNAATSPALGSFIMIENSSISSDPISIYLTGAGTLVYFGLVPGSIITLYPIQNVTADGAFQIHDFNTISGSHATTATGIWAAPQDVTIKYNYSTFQTTLTFPEISSTANTAAKITITNALPAFLRPLSTLAIPMSVQNNSAQAAGVLSIGTDGTMVIGNGVANGNFTGSGTGGFYGLPVVYDVSF